MGKNRIIDDLSSLKKLNSDLKNNFSHGFSDFHLAFLIITGDLRWATSDENRQRMDYLKQRKKILSNTLDKLIIDLEMAGIESKKNQNEKIDLNELFFKTINHYNLAPFVYQTTREIGVINNYVSNSHLKTNKIRKSHKIASIWAHAMRKNEKYQWGEIHNLLSWYYNNRKGTNYFKILDEEFDAWDPKLLARSFYYLRTKYEKEIEQISYICFEWEDRYKLYK